MTGSGQLWTIGHSNLPLAAFLELLARHEIEALVDIRRFPGSRKHPHFNREALQAAIEARGVDYHWMESLGGRRSAAPDAGKSPNGGLRNASFRNFADYMLTPPFEHGLAELLQIVGERRTTLMCAEGLFWRCHRRLISDILAARGAGIAHIFPNGTVRPHVLTEGARVEKTHVVYPGEKSLFEADG